MNANTVKNSMQRLIDRHGVVALLEDGTQVRGMFSPLRDTPRADWYPEGNMNLEAEPRQGFRSLTTLKVNESVTIAGLVYRVEMVTPVVFDDQAVSFTSVLLMKV